MMLRLLLLITVFHCASLPAQTESMMQFETEIDQLIIKAAHSGVESLTLKVHSYQSEGYNGEKEKVHIKFRNDSVYEQRVGFSKEAYVIRGNWLWRLETASDKRRYGQLVGKDSADCKVYWGEAYEGMEDSSMISYSRYQHDSSGRLLDYYFTYNNSWTHTVWMYEGDSAHYSETWNYLDDSLRFHSRLYWMELWNADSTFCIRTIVQTVYERSSQMPSSTSRFTSRTYVTYDPQDRIVFVRKEDTTVLDGQPDATEWHTLSVVYSR